MCIKINLVLSNKMDFRINDFKKCYTSVVHDVMRSKGFRNFTLPNNIRPIETDYRICGPAFTIEGKIDETADDQSTLLEWTGLLSKAKSGHIWIAQPNNHIIAQMGELSAEVLYKKGVLGCILDGLLRDREFIKKLGLPCWSTGYTPRDIVGYWMPTKVEETIMIGEVEISPGDWLHADSDGIVRIKSENLDEVIKDSMTAMNTENKIRSAILEGMDPKEAYKKFGKF